MRRYLIAAAIIISLLFVVSTPSIAEKYVQKLNHNTGQFEYVPKSYSLKYNNLESRWEWAPSGAQLTYDPTTNEWRYIPGIPARK